MRRVVGGSLAEDDAAKSMRIERANGCGRNVAQRNFNLCPATCRDGAAEFAELKRWRKIVVPVLEVDEGQILHSYFLRGITPQIKGVAEEIHLIADIDDANAGIPAAVAGRLPAQSQRIRRSIENLGFDGKFAVDIFHAAGRGRFGVAIEIRVVSDAVVEKSVTVIGSVGMGKGREEEQGTSEGAEREALFSEMGR